jgi:hypothetical protein
MILCTIRIIRTASNTLSLIQDGLLVHWQELAHMSQLQHYGRELRWDTVFLTCIHTGMEIFQIPVIESEEGTKWLVGCTIVEPLSLSLCTNLLTKKATPGTQFVDPVRNSTACLQISMGSSSSENPVLVWIQFLLTKTGINCFYSPKWVPSCITLVWIVCTLVL